MSSSPLFSIILTSYNYAEYVRKAIESVLEQDYSNLELIIVDDSSTDESQEIIRDSISASDRPIKTIFKNRTEGQGSAINTGYEIAQGDLVSSLDSDDYWLPNRLSQLVEFIRLVPDAGVYQHALDTGTGEQRGGMLSMDVFNLLRLWDDGRFNIADDDTSALHAPYVPTSGLAFRREILDKVMPIPAQVSFCPDAYLTRTCTAFGKLASLPLCLGTWRDHESNAGKRIAAEFPRYWLSTIMPALNEFYKANNLGLELRYDLESRTPFPVSLMLGQYHHLLSEYGKSSVRAAKMAEIAARTPRKPTWRRAINKIRRMMQ